MRDTITTVVLTTDGAARGNPGPGGWAALLEADGRERLLTGEEPADTTNNAMELRAAVEGLLALNRPCQVTLRADSQYVLGGLERLLAGGALPQKNRTLWQQLAAAAQSHTLTLEWVRGHAGDPRNERVDEAANAAASRAYATREASRAAPSSAQWILALLSPSAQRPVRWAVLTPTAHRTGEVAVTGVSQPTAVYQALVDGLRAAGLLAGASEHALEVVSNYELIIKQGRGEWKVKNQAQQPLAAEAAALRRQFTSLDYRFAATADVAKLLDAA